MEQKLLITSGAGAAALMLLSPSIAQDAFTYDKLGRLVRVDYHDGQLTEFVYDAAGNRVEVRQGGAPDPQDDVVDTSVGAVKDINVLANDLDLDGDTLTIVSASTPSNGVVQIVQLAGADWLRYTPNAGFSGADGFSYTVTDGYIQGSANVTVNVISSNDAPLAVDDAVSTNEDSAITISPLGNDSDPNNDPLDIGAITTPSHGSAVKSGSSIIYTPDANYFGADSFTYEATDGSLTSSATISVTVNSVNDAPVAVNDSTITAEDTVVEFDPRGNDSDIETPVASLVIAAATNGSKGTAAVINGGTRIRYTPNTNANGSDSFTYTIRDASNATDTASVSVVINSVDDPPTTPASFSTSVNENWTGVVANLSSNDPDGHAITYHFASGGNPNGKFSIQGNQLRLNSAYDREADGASKTVKVYARANGVNSGVRTSTITINNVDEPAYAVNDSSPNVDINQWATFFPLHNDGEDLPLTVLSVSVSPSASTQFNSGTGSVQLYPTLGQQTYTITYTMRDGDGDTDSATITVTTNSGGCPTPTCLPDF